MKATIYMYHEIYLYMYQEDNMQIFNFLVWSKHKTNLE